MRERWFFAQGEKRRGPFSLAELLAAVQGEPDPRAVLVWRKGLREWTLAEGVPEVARQLERARTPELSAYGVAAGERRPAPTPAPGRALPRLRIAFAALAALVVIAAVALRLRAPEPRAASPGPDATNAPAAAVSAPPPAARAASPRGSAGAAAPPAPAPRPRASLPAPAALALGDAEAELPGIELRKLRGVAAWSGDTLKLTVYNATNWRVTEVQVRIERFRGEDFVADDHLVSLAPPPQKVDAGVADLLARVAPDRKKPGLNPLDTGVFEAKVGPAPEGFRWQLGSARGYPPAR